MPRSTSETIASEPGFDVVGIGALNVDQILRIKRLELSDDEVVAVDRITSSGGSAANTIFGLARLGMRTAYVGAVGRDEAGRSLRASFSSVGVDDRWIRTKTRYPTGEAICIADSESRRYIVVEPGANQHLREADLRADLPSLCLPARALHLTSFVGDQQLQLQTSLAHDADDSTLISFSPGALYVRRGLDEIFALASRCDVLFVNRNEIAELMGLAPTEYMTAGRLFLEKFARCRTVVITLGSGRPPRRSGRSFAAPDRPMLEDILNDTAVASGDRRLSCVVIPRKGGPLAVQYGGFVRAADPTGAGDAFAAGFLYALLRKRSLRECALSGHACAQFSVTGFGARTHLPTAEQLRSAMKSHSARIVPH